MITTTTIHIKNGFNGFTRHTLLQIDPFIECVHARARANARNWFKLSTIQQNVRSDQPHDVKKCKAVYFMSFSELNWWWNATALSMQLPSVDMKAEWQAWCGCGICGYDRVSISLSTSDSTLHKSFTSCERLKCSRKTHTRYIWKLNLQLNICLSTCVILHRLRARGIHDEISSIRYSKVSMEAAK